MDEHFPGSEALSKLPQEVLKLGICRGSERSSSWSPNVEPPRPGQSMTGTNWLTPVTRPTPNGRSSSLLAPSAGTSRHLLQRVEDEARMRFSRRPPTYDAPGEGIDDER